MNSLLYVTIAIILWLIAVIIATRVFGDDEKTYFTATIGFFFAATWPVWIIACVGISLIFGFIKGIIYVSSSRNS